MSEYKKHHNLGKLAEKSFDKEEFTEKFYSINTSNFYDLQYFNPEGKTDRETIICLLHGPFKNMSSNLLGKRSTGCGGCIGRHKKFIDKRFSLFKPENFLNYLFEISGSTNLEELVENIKYEQLNNLDKKYISFVCPTFTKSGTLTANGKKSIQEKLSLYLKKYHNYECFIYFKQKFKRKNWITYDECCRFARETVRKWGDENGYKSNVCQRLWQEYKKENPLPPNIPSCPNQIYNDKEDYDSIWNKNNGWGGFFGIEVPKFNSKKSIQERKDIISDNMIMNNKKILETNINSDRTGYADKCGIYMFIFPDEKKYVGQTQTTFQIRFNQHISAAKHTKDEDNKILYKKIRKLVKIVSGNEELKDVVWSDIFYHKVEITPLEVVGEYSDIINKIVEIKDLDKLEKYYIKYYKTCVNSKDYEGKMGLNIINGNEPPKSVIKKCKLELPDGSIKMFTDKWKLKRFCATQKYRRMLEESQTIPICSK